MTYNLRLSIHTLGCKLNQAESEELKKGLKKAGFSVVQDGDKADINIIRGCAVTCGASQTTRELARRAKRDGAYVIAIGCLENKNLPEIDFTAKDNEEVVRHLLAMPSNNNCHPELVSGSSPSGQLFEVKMLKQVQHDSLVNRTRAFIKIQNGCNFRCAYCVIPHYRGQSDSVPAIEVIKKIKEAEKEGYKEVVLTGVNICLYDCTTPSPPPPAPSAPLRGRRGQLSPPYPANGIPLARDEGGDHRGGLDLVGLLQKILKETKIPRIRLGSLDPRLITKELLSLYCHSERSEESLSNRQTDRDPSLSLRMTMLNRLLPHWHLSLQSGADKILKAMGRGYTAKKYEEIVKKLRAINPLFSFTTDIIVGFPGETDKDFEDTLNFVKKIGFAKVHVFPYSKRPGTTAEKLPGQIQDKLKTERAKKLRSVSEATAKKFIKKFSGLTRPVLFENKKDGVGTTPLSPPPFEGLRTPQGLERQEGGEVAVWSGYTPEYILVKRKSSKNLQNKIMEIKL